MTLATVGVVLTTAIVGAGAHYIFDVAWMEAFLLGAIVASTDAAAVFFLLRVGGITVRERVRSTLEGELGANDPMAIFLTATLVSIVGAGPDGAEIGWQLARDFALQIGLGAAGGVVGGIAVAALLARLRNLEAGLYPMLALSAALVVFAATGLVGGSGFCGLHRRPHRRQPARAVRPAHPAVPGGDDVARPDRDVPHARPARDPI